MLCLFRATIDFVTILTIIKDYSLEIISLIKINFPYSKLVANIMTLLC